MARAKRTIDKEEVDEIIYLKLKMALPKWQNFYTVPHI